MNSNNGPLVPGRIVLVTPVAGEEYPAIVSRIDDEREGTITVHYFHPDHSGAHAAKGLAPRTYTTDLGWRWPNQTLESPPDPAVADPEPSTDEDDANDDEDGA